jgi:hypothetical protein
MAKRYVSERPIQLSVTTRDSDFYRADIEFHGVDHSGATFEGRVFLNNSDANEKTPKKKEAGYAGSFYIFGHGGCFGDEGHCEVPNTKRACDLREPHALTPAEVRVPITDALRIAMKKDHNLRVTVVPVVMASNDKCDLENVFKFESYDIKTYAK